MSDQVSPSARVHRAAVRLDDNFYLPVQSEIDRALLYPYDAPEGAFVLNHGQLSMFDDAGILGGRTGVLSVGSNRAPVQLRRKFGNDAVVPVTPVILHDCDIVHVAMLGYYGALPCTAFPSLGTRVHLNVAWLDDDQLAVMHRSEAVGVAYDYVRLDEGAVTHLAVPEAGGHIVSVGTPIFGYSARAGVLDINGGFPAALSVISATGRQFSACTQAEAVILLRRLSQHNDTRSHADFVADMQQDKLARDLMRKALSAHALFASNPPWTILDVECGDLDAFL